MPVATSIMSGSIETIPTQPSSRSPKCTLPSRPRVTPPARPMYWAKIRAGVDAADDVRGQVAVQDAQPVLRRHREGAPAETASWPNPS